MLRDLLADGPAEGDDPGFEVRVRIAIAQQEYNHGSVERARLYLEEATDRAGTLDTRRRASFFDTLAKVRSAAGDYEAAIRAGTEALTLLREVGYEVQEASMENDMAMTLSAMGHYDRAEVLPGDAIATFERLEIWADLGHAIDTLAAIRLHRDDATGALELADRALAIEAEYGPANEQVGARITRAKALDALGRTDESRPPGPTRSTSRDRSRASSAARRILAARAQQLAAQGRHAEAYELLAGAG